MYYKSENMLFGVYAVLFGILFFSAGDFGLLNLFDIRREVQLILFLMLMPLFVLGCGNWHRYFYNPLFLLSICLFLGEVFLRQRAIHIADAVASIGILGVLFSLKQRDKDRILKWIIILSAVLSVMVIVQAVIVWCYPEVVNYFGSNYRTDTGNGIVEVGHPLEYLGFSVYYRGFHFLGHYFIRFQSFASEPTVLAYSFLVPGLLALTYRNYCRILAVPILFFSILLSGSGTIWLSVFMGAIFMLLFLVFRRFRRLLTVLPFLFILIFVVFLLSIDDISLFVRNFISFLSPFGKIHSEILYKHGSLTKRLLGAKEYLVFLKNYPMGLRFTEDAPVGLLFIWYHNAGYIAILFGCVVSFKVFRYSLHGFYSNRGLLRIAAGMIYGVFFIVLIFFGGKWDTFVGMMMLFLMLSRLEGLAIEDLVKEVNHDFRVPVPSRVNSLP